jgi:hypothetical protein
MSGIEPDLLDHSAFLIRFTVCNRAQVSVLKGETICCFTCPLRFSYTCIPDVEEMDIIEEKALNPCLIPA